ncbi:hypothetical protein [Myxosarcina sp. GI1(2024)]
MAPIRSAESSAAEVVVTIKVHIEPEVFQTFLGDCDLSSMGLEHLIRPSDRYYWQHSNY